MHIKIMFRKLMKMMKMGEINEEIAFAGEKLSNVQDFFVIETAINSIPPWIPT
jgi:hypothetical protein